MQNTQSAAVLLIGNELLSGSIEDKNLPFIAKRLEKHGIRVRETRIVPDIEIEIVEAVNHLRAKYDYVFTTGGIGPTHDDITSDSIAKAFNVENVVQESVFNILKSYFDSKGVEFTTAAQRMAYAPDGAKLIPTKSNIPAYQIDNVYVMAGVPRIMQYMLEAIVEHLKKGNPILSSSVHANVSEGDIAQALHDIQQQFPQVDIGSYPQDTNSTLSDYRVIFVVRGTEQETIQQVCEQILQSCHDSGHEAVHGLE